MIDANASHGQTTALEELLQEQLERGDLVAETMLPILQHLLTHDVASLFSEEVLARVRIMTEQLACAAVRAGLGDGVEQDGLMDVFQDGMVRLLLSDHAFISYLHAQAHEWLLTQRLEEQLALDPVASPLLQSLVAASDGEIKNQAIACLAAQSRWCQSQRRMMLDITELPDTVFDIILKSLHSISESNSRLFPAASQAQERLQDKRNGATTRLELMTALVSGLKDCNEYGLHFQNVTISEAGLAMFLTNVALVTERSRDGIVLEVHESQATRLVLRLLAAGMGAAQVRQNIQTLHPHCVLPDGFDALHREQAEALLRAAAGCLA